MFLIPDGPGLAGAASSWLAPCETPGRYRRRSLGEPTYEPVMGKACLAFAQLVRPA